MSNIKSNVKSNIKSNIKFTVKSNIKSHYRLVSESLPPENSGDLDAQMSDNMRILNELRQDLSQDLFISFHPSNVPEEKGDCVNPLDVVADLEAEGYTW